MSRPHHITAIATTQEVGTYGPHKRVCAHQTGTNYSTWFQVTDPRDSTNVLFCPNCYALYIKLQYEESCRLVEEKKQQEIRGKEEKRWQDMQLSLTRILTRHDPGDMRLALKIIVAHLDKFELSQTTFSKGKDGDDGERMELKRNNFDDREEFKRDSLDRLVDRHSSAKVEITKSVPMIFPSTIVRPTSRVHPSLIKFGK